MKQTTYLVTVSEAQKQQVLNSKMALIRDWNYGWFEVPQCFLEEFENTFGHKGIEHGVCKENITKEEINEINLRRDGFGRKEK